jgi:hypothetical protein
VNRGKSSDVSISIIRLFHLDCIMIPNIDDQSLVAESVEGIARKREGEKNYEREAINEIGMESVQQKKKTCK